jgi:dTDP-4-amino-4,6-dideoxygalactose transaminase
MIDEETIAGVAEVLRSGWITSGPRVKEFESRLSEYCDGRPVRVFSSGTAALEIALRVAGIARGHEVVTTPVSWVATSNVILQVGARPVFVDIDPITRNIDLDRIEAAITPATRALLPVDLAGLPVNRDRLHAMARARRLRVIEDAAQSFGSSWHGRRIGAFGDLVAFSFHPNKNLTTIEGGALVLGSEAEATLAEQYRLQGVVRTGIDGMDVGVVGGKFNLTDVAARVGLGQLPHLEQFNQQRRELARSYLRLLKPLAREAGLHLPSPEFKHTNWHMFQVVLEEEKLRLRRADVMAKLHAAGIGSGVHYPAIHLFSVYRRLGWKEGDFPIAERIGRNILTLPLFPAMTASDVTRVVENLVGILHAARK